jgi:putative lipoic acid-binding regulatory protein
MLDDPNLTSRPSANGRYRAFTLEKMMHSSDEVIGIYEQMERIPGIISI